MHSKNLRERKRNKWTNLDSTKIKDIDSKLHIAYDGHKEQVSLPYFFSYDSTNWK